MRTVNALLMSLGFSCTAIAASVEADVDRYVQIFTGPWFGSKARAATILA
jgi:hypothetical protein